MRVESVTVHGFGCLPERRWNLPADRAVLIIAANEAGKSTFAAAVLAGICGFPKQRRSANQPTLLDVYRPWDREAYAVELELEAGGKKLHVRRDFDRGAFCVRDRETGKDITADFEPDIAKTVLGISRDDLLRIAFVSGKQIPEFGSTPDLRARLSALVEGRTSGEGAEKAVAALEDVRVIHEGKVVKIETALQRISSSIDEHKRLQRELEATIDSAGEQAGRLEEARVEFDQLRIQARALEAELNAARLREIRERISRLESALSEKQELESAADFPLDRAHDLRAAAERLRERSRQLEELSTRLDRVAAERAGAELRVRSNRIPASAGERELTELAGCRRILEDSRKSVEARELDVQRTLAAKGLPSTPEEARRQLTRRSATAAFVAAAGLLAAAAGLALAAARVVDPVAGAVFAAIGTAFFAGGLLRRRSAIDSVRQIQEAVSRLEAAREAGATSLENASSLLKSLGIDTQEPGNIEELMEQALRSLSGLLEDRRELRDREREAAELTRQIEERRRDLEADRSLVSSILEDAGIDHRLPIEDALRRFAEGEERCRRYQYLRDTLIPDLAGGRDPFEEVERLRDELSRLNNSPEALPQTARTVSEIGAELREVRDQLDEVQQTVIRLEKSVGELVDRYRREYPAVRERVEQLSAEYNRMTRFSRAVSTAAEVLRDVSRDSYRRWAAALNETASDVLAGLNPVYTDLRFDDDLRFTIRRASDGRVLEQPEIDSFLSTGAKDQIYLAVRLACCLELSRHPEPIPIILDDPLMTADDERFRAGMRYLAETVSKSNQVIVLSCHASRHDALKTEPWFHNGFAVLDLAV